MPGKYNREVRNLNGTDDIPDRHQGFIQRREALEFPPPIEP